MDVRRIGYLATLALALTPLSAARADSGSSDGLLAWLVGGPHHGAPSAAAQAPTFALDRDGGLAMPGERQATNPSGSTTAALANEPPPISANLSRVIPPEFLRQEVDYAGDEKPGAIIIDTRQRFLFFILPHGRAIRYGVGVGRPGFEWAGVKRVSRKAEWPDWTPPAEMILRRPDIPDHMAGGPDNPLGARALYLGSSLYRIHGTNEPWTIGTNVSSGCIRMMNEDVIDLYNRAKVGTKVTVI